LMSSSSSSSSSASLPCGTSTGNDVVSLYTKGRARALIYSPELTGLPRQAITAVALCSRAPHAPQPTRQYKCKRCGDLGHQQGGCSATPLAGWVAPPPRKRKEQKDPKPAKTKAKRKGIFSKVGPTQKKRGEMVCYKVTKDEVTFYFTSWQDTKPVHVLSTFQPFLDTCERNMKTAAGGWGGKEEIPKPTVVSAYNRAMGGTDLGDQLNSYYQDRHRVRFWQQRMYNHFLHVATNNAKVLMNSWVKKSAVQANKTLLTFQAMVSEE
jgi:hypothetical protein